MLSRKIKSFLQSKKSVRIAIVAVLILSFFYYFLFSPLITIASKTESLRTKAKHVKIAFDAQDLEFLPFEIDYMREDLVAIDSSANRLQIFSVVPYFGQYISDMKAMTVLSLDLIDTLVDLFWSFEHAIPDLNFKGWGSKDAPFGNSSLTEVSKVLAESLPQQKERLIRINGTVDKIDPNRYPEKFRGIPVRASIQDAKDFISLAASSFDDLVEVVEQLPELSGENGGRNYLILLQNSNSLRPSGGTLGAYAVFSVGGGNVNIIKSGDVLVLDGNNKVYTQAPDSIRKNLGRSQFLLTDASYSPDFGVSAVAIKNLWGKALGDFPIHGIIAIDTHFISALIDVLGGETIPLYDTLVGATTEEKLQSFFLSAGSVSAQDKKVKSETSTFLFELIHRLFDTSMQERASIIKAAKVAAEEKHILFNFNAETPQKLVEKYNFGGKVAKVDGDYLYINHVNTTQNAGSSFETELVSKEVSISANEVRSKLSIDLKNSGSQGTYSGYVRIYVPKGSNLKTSEGFSSTMTTGSDLDLTYFEGTYNIPVGEVKTLKIEYTLPTNIASDNAYALFVQKQPGIDEVKYDVTLNGTVHTIDLKTDTKVELPL